MRIQRTSQVITIGVISVTAVALACAVISLQLRKQQEQAYKKRRAALRLADQLAAGSNRLTSAVRSYAATGDRPCNELLQNIPE